MSQPPDDTPDFLRKPASPSGEQPFPEAPPTAFGGPTSPYVSPSGPTQPGYQQQPPYPPQGGYPPQGAYPPPPYGAYPPLPGMPGYPFAQAHGGANTAMGLGITSAVSAVLAFLCGCAVIGTLTGPFAIALAVRARKDMAQSPGLYNNEGAALTGLITGIVGTALGLAALAFVVFFIGAFFAIGTSGG